MKEFWTTIQVVFAGIGGWLGWFLGGCDGLLYALLAFVVIDYITGIMCAVVDKKLSSEVGFKGIFKKVLIFALVGIGHIRHPRHRQRLGDAYRRHFLLPIERGRVPVGKRRIPGTAHPAEAEIRAGAAS